MDDENDTVLICDDDDDEDEDDDDSDDCQQSAKGRDGCPNSRCLSYGAVQSSTQNQGSEFIVLLSTSGKPHFAHPKQ